MLYLYIHLQPGGSFVGSPLKKITPGFFDCDFGRGSKKNHPKLTPPPVGILGCSWNVQLEWAGDWTQVFFPSKTGWEGTHLILIDPKKSPFRNIRLQQFTGCAARDPTFCLKQCCWRPAVEELPTNHFAPFHDVLWGPYFVTAGCFRLGYKGRCWNQLSIDGGCNLSVWTT